MMLRNVLLTFVALSASVAQTPPSPGQQIQGQQIYDRFRAWISGQSLEFRESTSNEVKMTKYSEYLKSTGAPDADIASQLDVLSKQGDQLAAQLWNRLLTAEHPTFNTQPNAFLVEMVKGRKPGKALDVSMGQGRNTIWLAQQGWDVTGFDPADKALAEAKARAASLGVTIKTEVATDDTFDFGENRYDLILLSYAGCAENAERVQKALKPGGILVVEAFHKDSLKAMKIGGSICGTGELPHAFQGLRTLHYEEPVAQPDWAQKPGRVVRFLAEKPAE